MDYFERAKRPEEIPLLQKSLEDKQVQDKAFWEQQERERILLLTGETGLLIFGTEYLHPKTEVTLKKLQKLL